jgi:uncharacterized protein involved in copper resistance
MNHGSMGAMDHSNMGAMDHSKMKMDDGQMTGMESMDEGTTTTSRTPVPVLTDADRAAAFPDVAGHGVHDKTINSFMLLDKFEYQDADNGSALAWDAKGWIGGDVDRLWLRSEGERTNGVTETLNYQRSGGTPSVRGGMSSPVYDKTSNQGHLKPGERSVFRAWPSITLKPKRLPTSVRTVKPLLGWKAITTFC